MAALLRRRRTKYSQPFIYAALSIGLRLALGPDARFLKHLYLIVFGKY